MQLKKHRLSVDTTHTKKLPRGRFVITYWKRNHSLSNKLQDREKSQKGLIVVSFVGDMAKTRYVNFIFS